MVLVIHRRAAADDSAHLNKQKAVHFGVSERQSFQIPASISFSTGPSAEGGYSQAGERATGLVLLLTHHLESLYCQP